MSDYTSKISELNSLVTGNLAGEIPLSLTLSSGTLATNKIKLSQLRDLFDFDSAYSTVEEGIAATVENQMFYVYVDSNKLSVNEYVRTNIGANAVIGKSGTKKIIYIPALLKHVKVQVESFAALREFKPWWDGQVVYLKGYYEGSTSGGGDFVGHFGTSADDGGAIATGSNFYWTRIITDFVSPEMFGAIPGDTDSIVNIQNAVNYACGKYPVNFSRSNYSISSPIYVPSNSTLNGNGAKIKTLTAIDTVWMKGAIFAPGNYHPEYVSNVPKDSVTSTLGSNILTGVSNATGKYSAGDLIRVSSLRGILNGGFLIPYYMRLCKVTATTATTVTLDIPINYSGTDLQIMQANQSNYNARFNVPLFVCENSIVQDFIVDTWDHWTGDSATFNCLFRNITGNARAVVYGNTFCRTKFDRINITFRGRISELAFGSHDTTITNLTAIAATTLNANDMISWAENGDNCHLDGFTLVFNAGTTPSVICRFSSFTNSSIRNGIIIGVSNGNNILSFESYGGDRVPCTNNIFENITVNYVTKTAVICDSFHSANDSLITGCMFKNINNIGVKPDIAILRGYNAANVTNPIKGLKATITSLSGGAFVANNSTEWQVDFTGPITISNLAAVAGTNRVKLYNTNRFLYHANESILENNVSVTDTSTSSIYKTINYPSGTIRLNDEIVFKLEGSTAGNLGTKTIAFGFLDKTTPNKLLIGPSLTHAAGGTVFNIEGTVSIIGGFGLITAVINDNGTIKAYRAIAEIDPITSADFTLNVILRNAASGDTINLQRLTISHKDLTW